MIDIYQRVVDARLTMTPMSGVLFAMDRAVEAAGRGGCIVECGCWRGGVSIAMALAQREQYGKVRARVFALDSFDGLPPATKRDGPAAIEWQRTSADNCRADYVDMMRQLDTYDLSARDVLVIPGSFDATIVGFAHGLADPIQLLRIDCDWYDSVTPCLEMLEPLVAENGMVIVDDYYAWDGCARAVHDYFSRHDLPYRMRSLPDASAAFFTKQSGGRT